MQFSGKVGNGPVNKWLNFGGDPDHRLQDTRIIFRVRHYWEIRKVVNGRSFTLIRKMAPLVRRALAAVCTVPVLLVWFVFELRRRSHQWSNTLTELRVFTLIALRCVASRCVAARQPMWTYLENKSRLDAQDGMLVSRFNIQRCVLLVTRS